MTGTTLFEAAPELWRGPCVDPAALLSPLVEQLRSVEVLQRSLRKTGGTVADVRRLGRLLREEIVLQVPYEGPTRVSLTEPATLRNTLAAVSPGIRLDIRTDGSGLPSYYLYRTSSDYFGVFSLILEDYHRFKAFDDFGGVWDPVTSTSRHGAVERLLRLSPLRREAEIVCRELSRGIVTPTAPDPLSGWVDSRADRRASLDQLLYDAGRLVFDAAWHDDQRLAFATCELLDMPRFRCTLELLYLCLGGDLTRLRAVGGGRRGAALTSLFRRGYPQPAIVALVRRLADGDGAAVSIARRDAEVAWRRLARLFSGLMQSTGGMVGYPGDTPLYKIVLASWRRIGELRGLRNTGAIVAGRETDAKAWEIARSVVGDLTWKGAG